MIHIEPHPDFSEIDLLERAARQALEQQSVPENEIAIVLSDDKQLQELNRAYLGIDAPTDVLSFPASESDPETGARYLGDIIISVERAKMQALSARHELQAELQLLVVHGVLHLLGYDHAEAEGKKRMWAAQAVVLKTLGLSGIKINE